MTKEAEHVLKLDNRKKYTYFIHKIADYAEVWSLVDADGWAELELGEKSYSSMGEKRILGFVQVR